MAMATVEATGWSTPERESQPGRIRLSTRSSSMAMRPRNEKQSSHNLGARSKVCWLKKTGCVSQKRDILEKNGVSPQTGSVYGQLLQGVEGFLNPAYDFILAQQLHGFK